MYYELYIDILFLTNFMMDSLLLLAVRKMLKCPVSSGRVLLGSAAGAALACLLTVCPLPAALKLPAGYAGIGSVMVWTGLNQRGRSFWKAFGLLYAAAFLMGGILQAFRPWLRTGSIFFAAAVAAYYLLSGIWQCMLRLGRRQAQICEVVVHTGEEICRMHALLDTGNGLTDPVSGEPVCVIDPECAGRMFGKEKGGAGMRFIPYRTVGGEGVMPVFRAEQMEVRLPDEEAGFLAEHPIIGICEGMVSEQGDYQMILNPDILVTRKGGRKNGC